MSYKLFVSVCILAYYANKCTARHPFLRNSRLWWGCSHFATTTIQGHRIFICAQKPGILSQVVDHLLADELQAMNLRAWLVIVLRNFWLIVSSISHWVTQMMVFMFALSSQIEDYGFVFRSAGCLLRIRKNVRGVICKRKDAKSCMGTEGITIVIERISKKV